MLCRLPHHGAHLFSHISNTAGIQRPAPGDQWGSRRCDLRPLKMCNLLAATAVFCGPVGSIGSGCSRRDSCLLETALARQLLQITSGALSDSTGAATPALVCAVGVGVARRCEHPGGRGPDTGGSPGRVFSRRGHGGDDPTDPAMARVALQGVSLSLVTPSVALRAEAV